MNKRKPVLGLFDIAIKKINKALEATDIICRYIWERNCKKCKLRRTASDVGAIMCKYPERINYIHKDNCRYGVCPLIHK